MATKKNAIWASLPLALTLALVVAQCILNSGGAAGAAYRSPHTSSPITFRMSTVDDSPGLGTSGLIGQDVDEDGFLDLVSFAYNGTVAGPAIGEIFWYQYRPDLKKGKGKWRTTGAASWNRRLIAKKARPVHGAFIDVDGDGHQDLIFFSDFNVPIRNESNDGSIWWARRPSTAEELSSAPSWPVSLIGRSLGAHRIVAVPDLDGSGAWGVVVVPLVNPGAFPTYGPAPVTLYVPGPDPTLPWTKTVSSQLFHVAHDAILGPKRERGDTVLFACGEGIQELSFGRAETGGGWELRFATAHPPPTDSPADIASPPRDLGFAVLGLVNPAWNLSGVTSLIASEDFLAGKGSAGTSFLAAVDYTSSSGYLPNEPWHGDTVSVYYETGGGLQRQVLERRDGGGHHVQIADFNGDGSLDVAAGFRAYPSSLVLYLGVRHGNGTGDGGAVSYEKQIISERAAQQLVAHDWNRDGKPDIATAGDGNSGDPYILLWTNQGRLEATGKQVHGHILAERPSPTSTLPA